MKQFIIFLSLLTGPLYGFSQLLNTETPQKEIPFTIEMVYDSVIVATSQIETQGVPPNGTAKIEIFSPHKKDVILCLRRKGAIVKSTYVQLSEGKNTLFLGDWIWGGNVLSMNYSLTKKNPRHGN